MNGIVFRYDIAAIFALIPITVHSYSLLITQDVRIVHCKVNTFLFTRCAQGGIFLKKVQIFFAARDICSSVFAIFLSGVGVRPLDKGCFDVIYLHCHSTVINTFLMVLITLLTIAIHCKSLQ